jgi:hypothetical protein
VGDAVNVSVGTLAHHLVYYVLVDQAALLDLDEVLEGDVFGRAGEAAAADGVAVERWLHAFAYLA